MYKTVSEERTSFLNAAITCALIIILSNEDKVDKSITAYELVYDLVKELVSNQDESDLVMFNIGFILGLMQNPLAFQAVFANKQELIERHFNRKVFEASELQQMSMALNKIEEKLRNEAKGADILSQINWN